MIKKFAFLLLSFILFSSLFYSTSKAGAVYAQSGSVWLSTTTETDSTRQPQIEVQSISETSLQIQIRFPGIWADSFKNDQGEFSRLFLEGYGQAAPLGAPDLPIFTTQVEIPIQAAARISKVDVKTKTISLVDYGLPATIMPRQMEASKSGPTPPWQPADEMIYQQNQIYPPSYAHLPDSFQVRDHHILPIQIQPVRYQPQSGQLELLKEITFTITWDSLTQPDLFVQTRGSAVFDDMVSEMVLNPNTAASDTKRLEGIRYLIITPASLAPSLAPFVDLKEAEGYDVTVETLETIGSTNTAIKTYIEYAYHNWAVPPTYLLLVGDTNYVPSWPTSQTPVCTTSPCFSKATDLYYATMTADYVPDLLVGRLPAQNQTQLDTILSKLTSYAALTGNEDWVQKAAFVATADSSHYPEAEGSHNYVITTHTLPRGYSGSFPTNPSPGGDKLYYVSESARETDLKTAINDERSLVIYSGHGSPTSWSDFGFTSSDINTLDADQVYPFVAGFACETNDIANTSYPTVFGETWLVTPNKGAIVYLGSADYSYWGPDDVLERRLFDKFYEVLLPQNTLSTSIFHGLTAVQNQYSDFARYYWETYMLLGDPSIRIKTPTFSLSTNPDNLGICAGNSSQSVLSVTSFSGLQETVSLSSQNVPTGLEVKFEENPVIATSDTIVTITSDSEMNLGEIPITIIGQSDTTIKNTILNLSVVNQTPLAPLLASPLDRSTVDSLFPIFTWETIQQAKTYHFQIATDPLFSQVIIDADNLSTSIFEVTSALESNSTYYWRVQAINACGSSIYLSTRQFRTPSQPGDCPVGYAVQTDYLTSFESDWVNLAEINTNRWARQTVRSQTPNYAYFVEDIISISLQHLISPQVTVLSETVQPTLRFWQWFDIEGGISETCFDGGIIQYSLDNGNTWMDFYSDQYLISPPTGNLADSYGNPLIDKTSAKVWCGSSESWPNGEWIRDGWVKTVIDLSDLQGQTNQNVEFRFLFGTDSSSSAEGWYIDDVRLQSCYPLEATYLPLISR
ncbi:MAG: hypothetical protein CL609_20900 [Anaerolineaceae bacterium]|nr:hypothetical protein [Anaerolineaceae bacterium]